MRGCCRGGGGVETYPIGTVNGEAQEVAERVAARAEDEDERVGTRGLREDVLHVEGLRLHILGAHHVHHVSATNGMADTENILGM
jgi:hypothetical protein